MALIDSKLLLMVSPIHPNTLLFITNMAHWFRCYPSKKEFSFSSSRWTSKLFTITVLINLQVL